MDADTQTRTIAALDDALAPVRAMAAQPGPMNTSQLGTVAASFRQALLTLVLGPPNPATPQMTTDDDPTLGGNPAVVDEPDQSTGVADSPAAEASPEPSAEEEPLL